jgi:hypothetical protein
MSITNTVFPSGQTTTAADNPVLPEVSTTNTTDPAVGTVVDTNEGNVSTATQDTVDTTPVTPIVEAPVAVLDTPVPSQIVSAIAPAPTPVAARHNVIPFTEMSIVIQDDENKLKDILNPPTDNKNKNEVKKDLRYFITANAIDTLNVLSGWAAGTLPLNVFAGMDSNGTLKQPVMFGPGFGPKAIVVIHHTGAIVHHLDQDGKLIGVPELNMQSTFTPQAPVAAS